MIGEPDRSDNTSLIPAGAGHTLAKRSTDMVLRGLGLARTLDARDNGPIVTVFSDHRGAVGKSTIAINLAVALAQAGRRVALVDLHLRFGDVAVLLDIPVGPSITDLVAVGSEVSEESLRACMWSHKTGVSVIPSPFGPNDWRWVRARVGRIESAVTLLAKSHDCVILDTGSPSDHVMALALKLATTVLFVTTPDILDDSRRTLGVLRDWGYPQDRVKLVINATNASSSVQARMLGRDVFWSIPYDRNISMATQLGMPVVVAHPNSEAAQSIAGLAHRLAGGLDLARTLDARDIAAQSQPKNSRTNTIASPKISETAIGAFQTALSARPVVLEVVAYLKFFKEQGADWRQIYRQELQERALDFPNWPPAPSLEQLEPLVEQ